MACYCPPNAIPKSIYCILHYLYMLSLDRWFVLSFEFGATVLGSTFETATVLSSCHCRAKFIWVRYGSSTTFRTSLSSKYVKSLATNRGLSFVVRSPNLHFKISSHLRSSDQLPVGEYIWWVMVRCHCIIYRFRLPLKRSFSYLLGCCE